MEGFDFGGQVHVLGWEEGLENPDRKRLRRKLGSCGDIEQESSGLVERGNREQTEPGPVGLSEQFRFTIVEAGLRVICRAGDTQGFAELDLLGGEGTFLRNGAGSRDRTEDRRKNREEKETREERERNHIHFVNRDCIFAAGEKAGKPDAGKSAK